MTKYTGKVTRPSKDRKGPRRLPPPLYRQNVRQFAYITKPRRGRQTRVWLWTSPWRSTSHFQTTQVTPGGTRRASTRRLVQHALQAHRSRWAGRSCGADGRWAVRAGVAEAEGEQHAVGRARAQELGLTSRPEALLSSSAKWKE